MQDDSNSIELVIIVSSAVTVSVVAALLVVGLVFGFVLMQSASPAATATPTAAPQPTATTAPTPSPTPVTVRFRDAPPDPSRYAWVDVATGFDNPLFVTHAGDGSGRIFGVEQTGKVWIINPDGTTPFEPFLDISDLLSADVFRGAYTERGLLSIAFHPNYKDNGIFFVHHTDELGDSVIARYQVSADPNLADPDSAVTLLTVDQPFVDHNGGSLAFGPDGYLYIGFGDGGNANEPNARSQDPSILLGKILRVDIDAETYTIPPDNPFVDNPDYRPEIWALGARNPWRFSFDRATGDFYLGDVGQFTTEEIDYVPAGYSLGLNFGWSAFEGTKRYLPNVDPLGYVTMPIYEYPHEDGCSVTGGYVYRGAALPELQGYYFYGDYCSGRVWVLYRNSRNQWQQALFTETQRVITSFGEDEAGELYLVDYKGAILKLTAAN